MNTPLSAFATYKTMKPAAATHISKKKKRKLKKKHEESEVVNGSSFAENGVSESGELIGLSNGEGPSNTDGKIKKRKKKLKNKSNKKLKFQNDLPAVGEEASMNGNAKIKLKKKIHNDELESESDENDDNVEAVDSNDDFEIVPVAFDNVKLQTTKDKKKQKMKSKKADFTHDSTKSGEDVVNWMISPLSVEDFMSKTWEKEPVFVCRKTPDYYSALLSTPQIDEMLRNNSIIFGKNLDVTSYTNGERETHNSVGRALPHVVWDFYENKCSIRLLNPQTYCKNLHTVNAMMQEYFGCFVGANAYLTPPDSQGFAPHFDDIEAFILQIEGQKKWKVYKPRLPAEELPRFSSRNLTEEELDKPVMEVTLKAGDMLYFPRGYIHQGCTDPDYHSLHVTISVYQRNSFADLLEKALPVALHSAIKSDIELRKGLPLNMINQFGFAQSGETSDEKRQIIEHVKSLLHRVVDYIDLDSAVDSVATSFMHDALPPVLTLEELSCTVDSGLRMTHEGHVINRVQLDPSSSIKFIRRHCCRLVQEESEPDEETGLRELEARLYYTLENSLEYHGNDPQFLVVPDSLVGCVISLIKSYPKFVKIEDLGHSNEDEILQLLTDFWEHGLLLTEEPLVPIEEPIE